MTIDSFHAVSLIFAHIVLVVGSFWIHNENDKLDVRQLRFVQFVLKLYAVVGNVDHQTSAGDVIVNVQLLDSTQNALLNMNVGIVLSIFETV